MNSKSESEPVVVFAGNIIQAGFVKSLLENGEIKAYFKDEAMGTLIPFYVSPGGAGSVKIVVAGKDVEMAKNIIQEYEASQMDELEE